MSDRSDHTGGKAAPYIEDKYRQVLQMAETDPALKQIIDQISTFNIDTYALHFAIARVLHHLEIDEVQFWKKYWSAFHSYREEDRQVDGASDYLIAQYFLMDYARQKRGLERG
jgi:hypothetical protein